MTYKEPDTQHMTALTLIKRNTKTDSCLSHMYDIGMLQLSYGGHTVTEAEKEHLYQDYLPSASAQIL